MIDRWIWWIFWGCQLVLAYSENDDDEVGDRVVLNFAGTFPMQSGSGGWAGGQACHPAVQMALRDVNNNKNILPGYYINMTNNDSMCQPGLAIQQLYDFLYLEPKKLMLLAGCSPVTTVLAEAAHVFNLVVLSYGGSSPALSNRKRFKTLFRTHPSANMQNPTRVHLMNKFNWKRFTILMSVEEVFVSTAKDLERQARHAKIKVDRQSFYGDPSDAMKTLQRQDARIIVGLFYETEARKVLCQAYQDGLYGSKYVWFFIGWFADTWFIPKKEEHLNCTAEEMAKAAEYHFTTESVMLSPDETKSIGNMTGKEFQQRLTEVLRRQNQNDTANIGGFPEAPLAYDAVWALALAFNCTMHNLPKHILLQNFDYNNTEIKSILFQCVEQTNFRGVSGNVKFSDSGDRIARTQIEQLQNGKYKIMGYYDTTTVKMDWYNSEKWNNRTGPPPDSLVILREILTVSTWVYYTMSSFATLGIVLCILIYLFTRKHQKRLIIIQSQSECNNLLIVGCSLCLFSLFLIGLPMQDILIPEEIFSFLCHARVTILLFGFTFAYGSMFAKVWIVHRMGATENQQLASRQKDEYKPLLSNFSEKEENTPWEGIRTLISTMVGRQALVRKSSGQAYGALLEKRNTVLNQPIAPSKFYLIVLGLFIIDTIIITGWILLDPLVLNEQKFPVKEPEHGEEALQPVFQQCKSEHQDIWTGIILGYKCLLLVFGLFLSYETRNLKLRFVNDSRLVGLAIYNVAVVTLITAPVVTLLIHGQANANFAFISLTVIICTYISMGLIFGPKIRHILKVPPGADEVQQNGSVVKTEMSKPDQKRLEMLKMENETLQKQIEEKERRIHECKERLELLAIEQRKNCEDNNGGNIESDNINAPLLSEVNRKSSITYSTPTTLTTTIPLMDFINGHPGQISENEDDRCSTSSDEILL
ncbi:unnamed protein product [Caenorhabditis angaria]|uniref:G-protein coupled receptors family 3 profile domain-containing protein n=1 Tax=Caenorhabditis angaria TaxID=860376 RepID=A0A9P1NAX0_9PELO|nr:unnamed protein product [Caenorhabditis angaria]